MEQEVIDKLKEKLDPAFVAQREGAGGKKLDYLEAWYCIDKANEIFGFGEWSYETKNMWLIGSVKGVDKYGKERTTIAYGCTGRVTIGNCVMEGTGFGNGFGKDELEGHELAMKESESDAKKRCLMNLGNQFGLALYDKTRKNVGKPEVKKKRTAKQVMDDMLGELAGTFDQTDIDNLEKKYEKEIEYFKGQSPEMKKSVDDFIEACRDRRKEFVRAESKGAQDYKSANYGV